MVCDDPVSLSLSCTLIVYPITSRSPTGSTSAVPQTAHISASSIKGERVRAATHDPDYKPDQPLTNSKPVQFLGKPRRNIVIV